MAKKDWLIKNKTLAGGLRTILLPRSEGATVTFLVLIGVGSRYETPKQGGLSHFLEHMFFKGTETRPTTQEIAEAIDGVGGEFNAFTGEEYTGYYVKVASPHIERGAEVVSDILLRPLFDAEEIEREKGVIIEEIRMYNEAPMRHIHDLWQTVLFGDHPLGRDIAGTLDTVNSFGRRDFITYTSKHYHTENAVVTVAGKFDDLPTQAMLKKLFAPLAKGAPTKPRGAPGGTPKTRFLQEKRSSLDQTHMIVGVPGISYGDDRRWAAQLLATVLGGGMSSRLWLSVRERHGLAYAVRMSSESFSDTGSLATQLGARTDKATLALKLVLEEYDRAMEDGVTKGELAKAKEMARGQLVMELEETNALAVFAGGQELLTAKVLSPDDMWKKIEAVTADDVLQVARDLLLPGKRAVALLSPHGSTKAFEKLLD